MSDRVFLSERIQEAADSSDLSEWLSSPLKRVLELFVVILAVPVVVPVIALLALISAFAFRASPFFLQTRRGLDGAEMRLIKLRSLPRTFATEAGNHEFEHSHLSGYSRLLRNSHLDELPQLFHVLTGKMALVGPRPMIDSVLELLDGESLRVRALVRPGLTGPWQISTMGAHSLHECTELDSSYVRSASLRNDIWIVMRTLLSSLGLSSAEPEDVIARLDS